MFRPWLYRVERSAGSLGPSCEHVEHPALSCALLSETEIYPHVFPQSSRPACTVLRAGQVTFTADVIQPPNIAYTREQFESIAS